ncbi:MAG: type 4a pilus biogenesis protein PilO [Candidatus Binatia bacterium]
MLERFFDLPFPQRLLSYGLLAIIIVGSYWYFLHAPVANQIVEQETKQQELETEQTKLSTAIKDRAALREALTEVEAQLKEATLQLPEEKEIPELLRQVSNLGRDSGLEITLFRQKGETLKDLHAEVPVEMAVRGSYHQVALFFEKVRELNRIVNIGDISMKDPEMRDGRLQIDAAFSATTYRFLTEEEQARIAKEKEEAQKKSKGKK